MLPVEKGQGQVRLGDQYLCDVEYEISEPMRHVGQADVPRIQLVVPAEHCATLLDAYEMVLVLANGRRHSIPRPLQHLGLNRIERYVESTVEVHRSL